LRNQELIRDARENFCLPDDVTGDYSVFFSLSSGEKVRVDGALF